MEEHVLTTLAAAQTLTHPEDWAVRTSDQVSGEIWLQNDEDELLAVARIRDGVISLIPMQFSVEDDFDKLEGADDTINSLATAF